MIAAFPKFTQRNVSTPELKKEPNSQLLYPEGLGLVARFPGIYKVLRFFPLKPCKQFFRLLDSRIYPILVGFNHWNCLSGFHIDYWIVGDSNVR